MNVPTEEQEQAALFQWAAYESHNHPELSLLHAIPNGGYRRPATAMTMKRTGVKKGVPDMCLPVPRGSYHGLYIELKRLKGGRVSPEQIAWMDALSHQGYATAVCHGWMEAREMIEHYLGGMNDGA